MTRRWLVFFIAAGVVGLAVWASLERFPAPIPNPRCDPTDLVGDYSRHATDMRGWLLRCNIIVAAAAAVLATLFLYLQLSHSWPSGVRYAVAGVAVALAATATGLAAEQSATWWAQVNAGSCLSDALRSPQGIDVSFVGTAAGLTRWETGVFLDAALVCVVGVGLGVLAYLSARRVARV